LPVDKIVLMRSTNETYESPLLTQPVASQREKARPLEVVSMPRRSDSPVVDARQPERPNDLRNLPLLIPVPRAAKLLGISRSAAYRCAASGDLPTAHLGGRVYVVTARLQSLLESA